MMPEPEPFLPVLAMTSSLLDWGRIFSEQFLAGLIPFAVASGVLYLVCYLVLPRLLRHRKVQKAFPKSSDVRREILLSVQSIAIFAAVGLLIVCLYRLGWTRLYFRIDTYGWPYFFFSLAFVIVLQDAWFYWTHRFLHWRPVYKRVHSVHHQSTNPTPWAAFAFHPLEALIGAAIFPLVVLFMPIHAWAEGLWFLYMFGMSAYIHLGYELMPRGFARHWLTRWHTTEMHHNMHHSHFRSNYGLYFTFWDSLMKTNHEEYEARFDELTGANVEQKPRKFPAKAAAARP